MAWKPDYVTSSAVKTALGITDSADDAAVALAIKASSRAIEAYAGRQFGQDAAPVARYFRGRYDRDERRHALVIEDLMDPAPIIRTDPSTPGTFDTTLILNTDFRLVPYNAAADGRPWTSVVGLNGTSFPARDRSIEITAKWGWAAVPPEVEQACLIQASRLFKRKGAPFGIAGSPEMGSELRLLAKLDPDVEALLAPLRRIWALA